MFHDGSEAVDFFFGVGDELDFAFGNERIVKHGGKADVVRWRWGNLTTSDERDTRVRVTGNCFNFASFSGTVEEKDWIFFPAVTE